MTVSVPQPQPQPPKSLGIVAGNRPRSTGRKPADRWNAFWFPALPAERLAVLSRILGATVLFTVFRTDRWAADHAFAPREFYQPVALARALSLPAPTPGSIRALEMVIAVATVAAMIGISRSVALRRAINAVVCGSYLLWLVWAFSFSKVDHDRLTIVVALGVLVLVPGVGRGPDRVAGWALRVIQVTFLLAYPLSGFSKISKSGLVTWANSAVFTRAIVRRGSSFGDWFAARPELLRAGQWAFITFEFAAILALSSRRWLRTSVLIGVVLLHVFTYLTIGINFLPHTVCLAGFLPLERLHPGWWRARGNGAVPDSVGSVATPTDGAPVSIA